MGVKDKPLITKEDLVDAISRHFVLEMKVDQNEEISKFLSLKREEARIDIVHPGVRNQRNNRPHRSRPTR